jgi:hypothetical protein
VFNHDAYDYCCVVIFAEDIYSTLKSTLHTSRNLDLELEEERAILARNIAQRDRYTYRTRFARDHEDVRLSTYLNESNRSKRLVKLQETPDGDRVFTVLRRYSLERNPEYSLHDDPNYFYTLPENERYSHVPKTARPRESTIYLRKGERVVKENLVDYDREYYARKSRLIDDPSAEYNFHESPHSKRYKLTDVTDYEADLYYGDINDVTRFEEGIVRNYPCYVPESCTYNLSRDHNTAVKTLKPPKTLSRKSKIQAQRNGEYSPTLRQPLSKPDIVTHSDFSFRKSRIADQEDDGIEVSYTEEEYYEPDHTFRESNRHQQAQYDRFSKISAIPRQSEREELRKTTSNYSPQPMQKVNNYRMTEKEDLRRSRIKNSELRASMRDSDRESEYDSGRRTQQRVTAVVTDGKSKPIGNFSPDRSMANRATTFSSAHKRKTRETKDYSPSKFNYRFEVSSEEDSNF